MGSCVSVHKDPDSLTKLRFSIGAKSEKLMIPSPVKEKHAAVNAGENDRTAADAAVTSLRSPARYTSVGSRDEAFFDSQPWLESDCEDDFVSVNGDFTPSRGNTPVHPNSLLGKVSVKPLPSEEGNGSLPEPPLPDKKKRLSELFKESLRNDEYYDDEKSAADKNEATGPTTLAQQLKSSNGTPDYSRANSGGSSERDITPNGELGEEDSKALRSPQCCLPKLRVSRSLNERRKRTSPASNGG